MAGGAEDQWSAYGFGRPIDERGKLHRRNVDDPNDATAIYHEADRARNDFLRPGRDRHRERAAVRRSTDTQPRADRGARATDRDERDPARYLEFAYRSPAGVRRDRQERRQAVRHSHELRVALRRGADSSRSASQPPPRRAGGIPADVSLAALW